MSTRVCPALESMALHSSCPLSADGALTAGGNATDPSGANEQASPAAAAAMENSPTEKQRKNKKSGICGFFRRAWQAVKCVDLCRRRGNKVAPLQLETDPGDPQQAPSGLESTAVRDPVDQQPSASSFESTALQDPADPQPGPVPNACGLKPTSDTDPAGPEPAKEPQPKIKNTSIFVFVRRTLRAMKCAKKRNKKNKVDPVAPQPNTDSAEPQADPSRPAAQDPADPPDASKPTPGADSAEPQADPSEAVALNYPDDPPAEQQPCSSGCDSAADLQNPGQSGPDQDPVSFASLYEVGKKISSGGFGTVFRGIRKADRLEVAIKLIPKRSTDQYIPMDGYSKPLLMEVALNLLLKKAPLSSNIVYMLEWFEEKDQHILILEYPQPCLNLKTILKYNDHKLTETQARGLLVQVVHAAKHCMNQGVFHRDLKLNNLLLNTYTMEVKLIDFGCSDLVKDSGYQYEFRGRHRPPEFYMRHKYHAGPTTVWTLGLMLFQIVTGRPAFPTKEDIIAGDLTFDSSLSRECQDVISQCLIRDPDKRVKLEQLLDHKWFQQEDDPAVAQYSGGVT